MLVYYIPESKLILRLRRSKIGMQGAHRRPYPRPPQTETPGVLPGVSTVGDALDAYAVDFATTILRQGLSTAIASKDARMLAPAAMMKTLSQWPDDCCM